MRTLSARDVQWSTLFGCVLVLRLLYPFFDSPLTHLYSDPLRHWETGRDFLHPTIMGSSDPYMYQLWIFLLQQIAGNSSATILTGCGVLCAAMPYGWYRALRELMPRESALGSAVLIGLWPTFLGVYGYFMTETLLLTLTGYGFALTLRAARSDARAGAERRGGDSRRAARTRGLGLLLTARESVPERDLPRQQQQRHS